jgi:predicted MFS family arabinose efflux permease
MACTYFLLPKESVKHAVANDDGPRPPAGRRPSAFDWQTYAEYLKRPGVGNLMLQFFLFSFAFSCFTGNFALFAERRFGWGPDQVGYLFAVSGFLGIILQGGLIGRLVKKFGEPKLAVAGFFAAAVAYAVLGLAHTMLVLGVSVLFSAFGNGVLRPVVTSRITQAVGRHEQGAALGVSQSLGSIAMTLAPPTGGLLINSLLLTEWGILAASVAALGLIAALVGRRIMSTEAVEAAASAAAGVIPQAQATIKK